MATLSASDCASNHNTAAPMCTQTHYLIKKKPRRISEKKLDNLQRNVYVKTLGHTLKEGLKAVSRQRYN